MNRKWTHLQYNSCFVGCKSDYCQQNHSTPEHRNVEEEPTKGHHTYDV